jgi:hypothetical protein
MNDGRTIAKLGAPIDDAAKVNEIVQNWGLCCSTAPSKAVRLEKWSLHEDWKGAVPERPRTREKCWSTRF